MADKNGFTQRRYYSECTNITFVNTHVINLIVGASYYKPPISLEKISTV